MLRTGGSIERLAGSGTYACPMSLGGFPGREPGTPPGRLAPAPAFIELTAGVWLEFRLPRASPALWHRYLEGAELAYRRRGVESALELDRVADGRSTSIFAVAREPDGEVVAGVHFQGPLLEVDQAHVSLEFAGSPGEGMVRGTLAYRIPAGVTEFKAGWVADGHRAHEALSDGVARCFVHGMRLLGARHGCCSAGAFATRRWESSRGSCHAGP